jgi:glycosyltransferase involved in cell wall biosynthesis
MRRFPEATGTAGGERPSVCIVTSELVGPFNNGGIGTSMTGLAECLADAGFPVTILYTGGKFSSQAELERWRGLYAGIGIQVDWIRHEEAAALAGPVAACGFAAPWLVYRYLRGRAFDVVQFNDCMGEGSYCLAMKRLGAAFGDTAMFLALHSPSQWIFEVNRTLPETLLLAAFNHAERLSVRAADLVWSPSRYLLDWIDSHGFVRPPATFLQRYVLPSVPLFGRAEREGPARRDRLAPREIVFFGRLEERKGLRLFCRALRLVEPLLVERGIAVTFLGKAGTVGNRPALDFVEEEARGWRFPWQLKTGLGQQEAVDLLRSGGRLAVIASPADNSPCTVYEALAYAIPLLAARTGGIPELIDAGDGEDMLFDYDPEALAGKLRRAIEGGLVPARPAEEAAETRRRWIGGFERWRDFVGGAEAKEPERRLCVLVDGPDGADLAATLASLDSPEVGRVLLVERRWGEAAVKAGTPLAVLPPDRPERLAAALGASEAEAVLILRAGVVLLPGAARRIVEALGTPGVDGLLPAASLPGATLAPLGGSPSFCLFEGAVPGGGLAVKAERLAAVLPGRALAPDCEHLALADLAVAAGLEIWPFVEPLLVHPAGEVADARSRSAPERIAAYAAAAPTERFYMAAIGYGGFAPNSGVGGMLRGARERMVALGLGWAAGIGVRILPRPILDRLRKSSAR